MKKIYTSIFALAMVASAQLTSAQTVSVTLSVDMTNYPPGTYFLQITNDSGVLHSSKFIKN